MLSQKQLSVYCQPYGVSNRCRYLAEEGRKFFCVKKSAYKSKIDKEIENTIKTLKADGKKPEKEGIPLGNHCEGFILLKNVEQGL
jgi:hypothetical protein